MGIVLKAILAVAGIICLLLGLSHGNIVLIIAGLALLAGAGIWVFVAGDFDGDGNIDFF